jgi:hypothetical protein
MGRHQKAQVPDRHCPKIVFDQTLVIRLSGVVNEHSSGFGENALFALNRALECWKATTVPLSNARFKSLNGEFSIIDKRSVGFFPPGFGIMTSLKPQNEEKRRCLLGKDYQGKKDIAY